MNFFKSLTNRSVYNMLLHDMLVVMSRFELILSLAIKAYGSSGNELKFVCGFVDIRNL